jgi:uncharacterized protein YbbC (DUF1343 family)
MSPVGTGLDRLVAEGFAPWKGRRVGLIANQTTVDRDLRHLADLLHATPGISLVALFGPEHGVRGDAQDMIGVDSGVDPATGVPEFSLYGKDEASLAPRPEWLDGIDLLVHDVQDIGTRYYTFSWTMLYAMRVAASAGVAFAVLDRPSPIGGTLIEGPSIREGFSSFVGAHPVPTRHGLTVGELALLIREECRLDLDLTVVPCTDYHRSMSWSEAGLPWVLPSPNMPTPDTALVYPGGCLIEGTNLSEGRGTTRPFELWGAPWLDGRRMADSVSCPGVKWRPCAFRPTFHKHAGQTCQGCQPHVTDPMAFRPLAAYTAMIAAARAQDPEQFAWRTEPYEFVREPIAIDLLYGSSREREAIEAGVPVEDIAASWRANEAEFAERRRPFLLYP